jgi:phage gp16-like protein
MKVIYILISIQIFFQCFIQSASAQNINLIHESAQTMLRVKTHMVETVSANGGYVWNYLPDFSRRWGEMEARYHLPVRFVRLW